MDDMAKNPGEKLIPEFSNPVTLWYHLARYKWAKQFAIGKMLLDATCELGYGSAMIAQVEHQVTGIDIE